MGLRGWGVEKKMGISKTETENQMAKKGKPTWELWLLVSHRSHMSPLKGKPRLRFRAQGLGWFVGKEEMEKKPKP